MKKLGFLVCLLICGGLVYGLWSYQLVQSKDGNYLRKKHQSGFSDFVVEEKGLDRLERKLTTGLEKLGKNVQKEWKKLSSELEDLVQKSDLEKASDEFSNDFDDLKKDMRKRYDKLAKKLESGDLDDRAFRKKVGELKDWANKNLKKLEEKYEK